MFIDVKNENLHDVFISGIVLTIVSMNFLDIILSVNLCQIEEYMWKHFSTLLVTEACIVGRYHVLTSEFLFTNTFISAHLIVLQ